MTDYRKRLEASIRGRKGPEIVIGVNATNVTIADLRQLLSEGERMRELVADLERRATAANALHRPGDAEGTRQRLFGKEAAYTHAAELARQALGDPE